MPSRRIFGEVGPIAPDRCRPIDCKAEAPTVMYEHLTLASIALCAIADWMRLRNLSVVVSSADAILRISHS